MSNGLFQGLSGSVIVNSMLGFILPLLIITMMTPPPNRHVAADWPSARNTTLQPGALREDALRLIVTKDGSYYFRNQKILVESLANEIHEQIGAGTERKIYLTVDARARYREVALALDEIRRAGLMQVVVLAEQPYYHK